MSDARDTGAFARFLMAGMGQGIQLGQNADSMRFARERAGVADQQQAFQNQAMMGDQAMRLMQIRQAAKQRADAVLARRDQERANEFVLKFIEGSDDATFEANKAAVLPWLAKASPGLQSAFRDRKGFLQRRKNIQEVVNSPNSMFDQQTAQRYEEEYGVPVPNEKRLKSAREFSEKEERDNVESLATTALDLGMIDPDQAKALTNLRNSIQAADLLDQLVDQKKAADKAAAEQEKATQTQTHQAHIGHLLQKKRAGVALSPQEEGMLATTPGLSEFEIRKPGGGQNPRPGIIDDDLKRVNQDLEIIQDELVRSGVLKTKMVGTRMELTGEIDEDVLRKDAGATQSGPLAARWAQYQQLLATRRRLMSDPARLSTGGQPTMTQTQGASPAEQLVNQMEAAGASDQEIAAALRAQGLAR